MLEAVAARLATGAPPSTAGDRMKTAFIVNPKSAGGATGRRWAELEAAIARACPQFEVAFTQEPMDAVALTRKALASGAECVVAVGGDGTINEVVNGFFENSCAVNPSAALGVLPRGTGGDFRKTFDWSDDVEQALNRLKGPEAVPIDVGRVEFVDHQGGQKIRYFANICSFGVSGVVDREVNNTSKALGGRVSFYLGSFKALASYKDRPVRLSIDGGAPETIDITTVAVANGRYFGGGMKVAPSAEVSDGLFDVTIWSGYGLSDFVFRSAGVYSGAHVQWKGTRTLRCRKLSAESDVEVLIDCDGEQPGKLPCTMTVLPSAIRLKV